MAKVLFGLEQQGHIQTIEDILERFGPGMEYSKEVWEIIGEKIGWCPFTAALSYFKYMAERDQQEVATKETHD